MQEEGRKPSRQQQLWSAGLGVVHPVLERIRRDTGWWLRSDLNRGPSDYESLALAN